ncbi:hypothetical protein E1J22_20490 [Xanthomonas citri]|nr:hypothetical protein [Xanthomonas citri]QGL18124.1 hypothetical protein GH913_16050 [Xanthomonas citri pv. malvacearum]
MRRRLAMGSGGASAAGRAACRRTHASALTFSTIAARVGASGHFAAMENPPALVDHLRETFQSLR